MKNYKDFIKEHLDIDPFGEEIWGDRFSFEYWFNKKYPGVDPLTIKELYCYNNQLTNLNGIENLKNLRELYCLNNQLTSLDDIENLRNLRELSCHSNQLNNLDGIENLRNLRELSCHSNQLNNLDGIENLENLETIYCYNNKFSDEYKKYLKTLKTKEIYV